LVNPPGEWGIHWAIGIWREAFSMLGKAPKHPKNGEEHVGKRELTGQTPIPKPYTNTQ